MINSFLDHFVCSNASDMITNTGIIIFAMIPATPNNKYTDVKVDLFLEFFLFFEYRYIKPIISPMSIEIIDTILNPITRINPVISIPIIVMNNVMRFIIKIVIPKYIQN